MHNEKTGVVEERKNNGGKINVNIFVACGTICSSMINFQGLKSNTITDVMLNDVHLNFNQPYSNCALVEGTFYNSPGAEKCKLLKEKKI